MLVEVGVRRVGACELLRGGRRMICNQMESCNRDMDEKDSSHREIQGSW